MEQEGEEDREELCDSARRVLCELIPYVGWFIKMRNVIEGKSLVMSTVVYGVKTNFLLFSAVNLLCSLFWFHGGWNFLVL